MKTLFVRAVTVALLSSLVACGFQLRGTIDLPPAWKTLHLTTVSPNSELNRELRDRFESNGIEWVDRAEAPYVLTVGAEEFERRNLTIGRDAKAAEFELTMSTTLQVSDRAGVELMPTTTLSTQKVMANDPENVTGKVEEVRLLQREMRRDLVQQLMRQIRFLATDPSISKAP